MSNEAPPISLVTIPTLMFTVIGVLIGILFGLGMSPVKKTDLYLYAACGAAVGFSVAAFWFIWALLRFWYPDRFYQYSSEVASLPPKEEQGPVMLVNIDSTTHRIPNTLHPDDWQALAANVMQTGKFGRDECILTFGKTDGQLIYKQIGATLRDIGVLMDYGNGYKVTDHIGNQFFSRIEKGDYNMLKMIPGQPLPTKADVSQT